MKIIHTKIVVAILLVSTMPCFGMYLTQTMLEQENKALKAENKNLKEELELVKSGDGWFRGQMDDQKRLVREARQELSACKIERNLLEQERNLLEKKVLDLGGELSEEVRRLQKEQRALQMPWYKRFYYQYLAPQKQEPVE